MELQFNRRSIAINEGGEYATFSLGFPSQDFPLGFLYLSFWCGKWFRIFLGWKGNWKKNMAGKIINLLKREHPSMSRKQRLEIALDVMEGK